MDGRAVADRIRERLSALGKSAAGVSLEAGLGRSAVQNILSGASESPRMSTLRSLAGPLECSFEYLIGMREYDSDDPFAPNLKSLQPSIIDRALILEANAYSPDYRSEKLELESVIGHSDLRMFGHRIEYYYLADNTGFDEGFRPGDVIFAASASERSPIRLFSECAVIVERRLEGPRLIEMTLRTVSIYKNEMSLHGRTDVIRLPLTENEKHPEIGDEFKLPDETTVIIRSMVVRLSRALPHQPSIYALQKDRTD